MFCFSFCFLVVLCPRTPQAGQQHMNRPWELSCLQGEYLAKSEGNTRKPRSLPAGVLERMTVQLESPRTATLSPACNSSDASHIPLDSRHHFFVSLESLKAHPDALIRNLTAATYHGFFDNLQLLQSMLECMTIPHFDRDVSHDHPAGQLSA